MAQAYLQGEEKTGEAPLSTPPLEGAVTSTLPGRNASPVSSAQW